MTEAHVVVSNLIKKDENYLLVQELKDHVKGKWNLPTGAVKEEESLVEAAKRECREETGLEARPESINGVYRDWSDYLQTEVIVFCFNSKITSGKLNSQDENISDVKFCSIEDIKNMNLRVDYIEEAIQRYEEEKTYPTEILEDIR